MKLHKSIVLVAAICLVASVLPSTSSLFAQGSNRSRHNIGDNQERQLREIIRKISKYKNNYLSLESKRRELVKALNSLADLANESNNDNPICGKNGAYCLGDTNSSLGHAVFVDLFELAGPGNTSDVYRPAIRAMIAIRTKSKFPGIYGLAETRLLELATTDELNKRTNHDRRDYLFDHYAKSVRRRAIMLDTGAVEPYQEKLLAMLSIDEANIDNNGPIVRAGVISILVASGFPAVGEDGQPSFDELLSQLIQGNEAQGLPRDPSAGVRERAMMALVEMNTGRRIDRPSEPSHHYEPDHRIGLHYLIPAYISDEIEDPRGRRSILQARANHPVGFPEYKSRPLNEMTSDISGLNSKARYIFAEQAWMLTRWLIDNQSMHRHGNIAPAIDQMLEEEGIISQLDTFFGPLRSESIPRTAPGVMHMAPRKGEHRINQGSYVSTGIGKTQTPRYASYYHDFMDALKSNPFIDDLHNLTGKGPSEYFGTLSTGQTLRFTPSVVKSTATTQEEALVGRLDELGITLEDALAEFTTEPGDGVEAESRKELLELAQYLQYQRRSNQASLQQMVDVLKKAFGEAPGSAASQLIVDEDDALKAFNAARFILNHEQATMDQKLYAESLINYLQDEKLISIMNENNDRLQEQTDKLDRFHDRLNGHEGRIDSNDNRLNNHEGRIDNLEEEMRQLKSEISRLRSDHDSVVTEVRKSIRGLQRTIRKQARRIDKNEDARRKQADRLAKVEKMSVALTEVAKGHQQLLGLINNQMERAGRDIERLYDIMEAVRKQRKQINMFFDIDIPINIDIDKTINEITVYLEETYNEGIRVYEDFRDYLSGSDKRRKPSIH